jgi:hypothetical protein
VPLLHFGFVLDQVSMPVTSAEATALGFDLSGDSKGDNRFGLAMATMAQQGIAVNDGISSATQDGTTIVLADLQASSLADSATATFATYYGDNPNPTPCAAPSDCGHHLDGTGTFGIAATSPSVTPTPGSIAASSFTGVGGELPFAFGFLGGVLELSMHDAHVELSTLSDAGFDSGRIGGTIPQADIDGKIYPALLTAFTAIVTRDCTGTTPPNCGCTTGSTGQAYIQLDANHDCVLDLDEVRANTTIATLFAPDVDTDGDTVADSLSCAFSVTGVKTTFAAP